MTATHPGFDAVVDAVMSPHGQLDPAAADPRLAVALRESGAELYRRVADQSAVALFLVSTDGWFVTANPATCRMLGRTEDELRGLTIGDITYDEDVEVSRARLAAALESGHDSYRIEKRYLRPDGRVVHADVTVSLVRDDSGSPLGFFASAVDESARVAAAADAARANRRADRADEAVRAMAASMDTLIDPWVLLKAVRDDAGRIVDFVYEQANRSACEHNGIDHDDLVGRSLLELLPEHSHGLLDMYAAVVDTGQPLMLDEYPFPQSDGSPGWYDNRGVRIGQDALSFTWRDVTAQHLMREELSSRASTDPLTGLFNRRGLTEAIARLRALGDERRSVPPTSVAVLVCDLDGLKSINDSYGHPAGDIVLRAVADRVAGALRGSDIVARVGGDEFTVVAPGVDDAAAQSLAVKIAGAVTRPLLVEGARLVPTLSIGIAVSAGAEDMDALIARADEQLLARKRALYGGQPRR